MVPLPLVMGRHSAHILLGGPDVRVCLQIGVRVVSHNVLLPPQERGHPDLRAQQPPHPRHVHFKWMHHSMSRLQAHVKQESAPVQRLATAAHLRGASEVR